MGWKNNSDLFKNFNRSEIKDVVVLIVSLSLAYF